MKRNSNYSSPFALKRVRIDTQTIKSEPVSPSSSPSLNEEPLLSPKSSVSVTQYIGESGVNGEFHGRGKVSWGLKGSIDGVWDKGVLKTIERCHFTLEYPGKQRTFDFIGQGEVQGGRLRYLVTCEDGTFTAFAEVDSRQIPSTVTEEIEEFARQFRPIVSIHQILNDASGREASEAMNKLIDFILKQTGDTWNLVSVAEDFYQISLAMDVSENDDQFLLNILNKAQLSIEARYAFDKLKEEKARYDHRNTEILKFRNMPRLFNVLYLMEEALERVLTTHRLEVIQSLPYAHQNELPQSNRVLLIKKSDTAMFKEISKIANPQFSEMLWFRFLAKIAQLDSVSIIHTHLTHELFPILLRSLTTLLKNVCSQGANLTVNDEDKICLTSKLVSEKTAASVVRNQQIRFMVKLLNHFSPGSFKKDKIFEYRMRMVEEVLKTGHKLIIVAKMKKFKFIKKQKKRSDKLKIIKTSNDHRIWICLLDFTLHQLHKFFQENFPFPAQMNKKFLRLAGGLIQILATHLEEETNPESQFKFFGNLLHLIVCFEVDRLDIIGQQISCLENIRKFSTSENYSDDVLNLIQIFYYYWEQEDELINGSFFRLNGNVFKTEIDDINSNIQNLLVSILAKNVSPNTLVNWHRSFFEFLKQLRSINMAWLVKKNFVPEFIEADVAKVINASQGSFVVIKSRKYLDALKTAGMGRPRHFKLELIHKFGAIVKKTLLKEDWSDEEVVQAIQLHFSTITKILDLDVVGKQNEFSDFDVFLKVFTGPLDKVNEAMDFDEFQKRLQNVENYFVSSKFDDVTCENILQKMKNEEQEEAYALGFRMQLDLELCNHSLEIYYKEFERFSRVVDQDLIVQETKDKAEPFKNYLIDSWAHEMKSQSIPSILAGVAAIWSKQVSKDLESTGKRMKPYSTQIICILRLLSVDVNEDGVVNHLAQVLTGQGKSVILGLLSTVLALCDYKCLVACYSQQLTQRDLEAFSALFQQFGVVSAIQYGTFKALADDATKITLQNGSTTNFRSLVNDFLLSKQKTKGKIQATRFVKKAFLVDEVDVFLSDKFYGGMFEPVQKIGLHALENIQELIWELASSSQETKETWQSILAKAKERAEELKESDNDFAKFYNGAKEFFFKQLELMCYASVRVSHPKFSLERYKLDDQFGTLTYLNDFGIWTRTTIEGYTTIFVYFKLKMNDFDSKSFENYGYLKADCGAVSYARLPRDYSVILGVTGTLKSLDSWERHALKDYQVEEISIIPSLHGESRLHFDEATDVHVLNTDDEWIDSIRQSIKTKVDQNRAVLIFFISYIEVDKFKDKLFADFARLHTFTGNESEERIRWPELTTLRWLITEACVAGTVTLCTRFMGRGIDFRSTDSRVEENHGVHVLQTFFSWDRKEEIQIAGRTARNGAEGSFEMILCREHLNGVSEEATADYDSLANSRSEKASQKGNELTEAFRNAEEKHDKTLELMTRLLKPVNKINERQKIFNLFPFSIE